MATANEAFILGLMTAGLYRDSAVEDVSVDLELTGAVAVVKLTMGESYVVRVERRD
jgi:hypothetical protein